MREMIKENIKQAITDVKALSSCREHSLAVTKLEEALHWLEAAKGDIAKGGEQHG